jgi:hypothetical protein
VEKILSLLTEIGRLTAEQRGLIALEDRTALELNIEAKGKLIEALKAMPATAFDDDAKTLGENIAKAERENIQLAKDEMEKLRVMMKKAQEGITTVRGYDAFGANVGATYIDKKK